MDLKFVKEVFNELEKILTLVDANSKEHTVKFDNIEAHPLPIDG